MIDINRDFKKERPQVYGLQLLKEYNRDPLIITDSILNSLSLFESLKIPVISFRSDEITDEVKYTHRYMLIVS